MRSKNSDWPAFALVGAIGLYSFGALFYGGFESSRFAVNLSATGAPQEYQWKLQGAVGVGKGDGLMPVTCSHQWVRGSHIFPELHANGTYTEHIFYIHLGCQVDYLRYPGGARQARVLMWRGA